MSVRAVWKANAGYDEFRREQTLEGTVGRIRGQPVLMHGEVPYVFTDLAPNSHVIIEVIDQEVNGELLCWLLDARAAGFILKCTHNGEPFNLPFIRIVSE